MTYQNRLGAYQKKLAPRSLLELSECAFVPQSPLGDMEPDLTAPAVAAGVRVAQPTWRWLRDLVVGTASAGGHTVATTTPIVDAATTLRGYSVVVDAGATVLEPSGGTASISVVATAPTASWVSENAADTASEPVFSAPIALTPATLRVTALASRQLLKMSPTAERAVVIEMLQAAGRAIDVAVLGAGGGAAPTGLADTTGRITQSGTSLSFATICDVERQVLERGVRLEKLRYVMTPVVRELLQTRERAAGSLHIIEADKIGSVPVAPSIEAPAGAMFLGDWSGCIVAMYGGRPFLLVNPFKYATSGLVEFSLHAEIGIGIPRPASFAHFSSIT